MSILKTAAKEVFNNRDEIKGQIDKNNPSKDSGSDSLKDKDKSIDVEELNNALLNLDSKTNENFIKKVRGIIDSVKDGTKISLKTLEQKLTPDEYEKLNEVINTNGIETEDFSVYKEDIDAALGGFVGEENMGNIKKGLGIFEKISDFGDKISSWIDKIFNFIKLFFWSSFPKLAEMFGIEKPDMKGIEKPNLSGLGGKNGDKGSEDDDPEKENTDNENTGNEDTDKVDETSLAKYKNSTHLFYRFFSPSQLDFSEFEYFNGFNKEDEIIVSEQVFESETFQNIKYNDLIDNSKEGKNIDEIYNDIKDKPVIQNKKLNEENTKKYIKLVILSIKGGTLKGKESNWIFKNGEKEIEINYGEAFIKGLFPDLKEKNPSMLDFFSNFNSEILENLENLFKDFDFTDITKIPGNLLKRISEIFEKKDNIDEDTYKNLLEGFKDNTKKFFGNIDAFKDIKNKINTSSLNRNLENEFGLDDNYIDSIKDNNEMKEFIRNDLIEFGNKIYDEIFEKNSLLKINKKIDKKDFTLKEVFDIYMITKGETDISKLSSDKKTLLTLKIILHYGGAKKLGEISGNVGKDALLESLGFLKDNTTDYELPPEVKFFLETIYNEVKNGIGKTVNYASTFFKGLVGDDAYILITHGGIFLIGYYLYRKIFYKNQIVERFTGEPKKSITDNIINFFKNMFKGSSKAIKK